MGDPKIELDPSKSHSSHLLSVRNWNEALGLAISPIVACYDKNTPWQSILKGQDVSREFQLKALVIGMGRVAIFGAVLFASVFLTSGAVGGDLTLNYSDPTAIQRALELLQNPGSPQSFDDSPPAQTNRDELLSGPIPCQNTVGKTLRCLPPEITVKALKVLADPDVRASLNGLVASKNLVWDVQSPKTIVVSLDAAKKLKHVDFVGLVRGKDEALPAPDAVSTSVIRFQPNGQLSIIERKADVELQTDTLKFSFEK